jgi:hypothetical protein
MIKKSLQCLSVDECFAGFFWQGNRAKTKSIPLGQKSSWKTACVQNFFSQYNWSGRPRPQFDSSQTEATQAFSVILPVEQFFDYFTWAGQPQIAPQPIAPNNPQTIQGTASNRDFKLSNFSNLF